MCQIVQRCIDAAKGPDKTLLIGAICKAALTLIQDPFGNYVVQYVLGLQNPEANSMIVSAMMGRLNVLSRQKFSSNVVERCLQLASPEDKARMITELAEPRGLGELLRDHFGNYVVQKALDIAVEPQISYVLAAVRPLLPSLRANGQGRRIAQKLEKKFPQLRGERGEARQSEPVRTSGGLGKEARGAGTAAAQGGLDWAGSYLVPGAVTPGVLSSASVSAGAPESDTAILNAGLYYYTGWDQCLLHGAASIRAESCAGAAFAAIPGSRLPSFAAIALFDSCCPKGESAWRDIPFKEGRKWKELSFEADGVEFVVCDTAKASWDHPPDWYGKANYLITEPGSYSLRNGHLRRVREKKVLVVTDLDHTLIGHERDPENHILEEFKATWLGEYAPNGSALAYSTGRNKSMALDVAKERGLPRPELMICGVGTEVYAIPDNLPLMGWWEAGESLELTPEWREKVLNGFCRKTLEETLTTKFPKFEVRGTPEADPYRIPTAYQMDEDFEQQKKLLQEGLGASYQVISSGHGEWKLVDVCGAEAGKGKALQFAMRTLGFEPSQTLACGDSGNDELMFRCDGGYGVMVANSLPELVEAMSGHSEGELVKGKTFKTRHGCTMLFASKEVAAGIVEALFHFWP
ncbi:unnamed protein product [Effrenium voratum]|nr:unnamed protein product [Effrenium voratum]